MLAFTLWEPAKRPKDPNGLIDADERTKLLWNVRRFCEKTPRSLSGAKFFVTKIYGRYGIKRLRDLPRNKLRSALCITSRWSGDSFTVSFRGNLSGIITEDVAEALGFTPTVLKARRKHHRDYVLRQNQQYGFNWEVPAAEKDISPPSISIEVQSNVIDFHSRRKGRITAGMEQGIQLT